MIALHHAIKIAVPRSAVFLAFADVDELAGWHPGEIEGEPHARTRVRRQDSGWHQTDAHLPLCNTYWGEALGISTIGT
ncbi:hypothetical protein [Paraburkholderia sp. 2C]